MTRPRLAATAALALLLFVFREKARSVFGILDGIDLVIHEAGHPILGLFGWRWLMVAGGTIFQLAFPIAFIVHFRKNGQPRSADACVAWLGQNFLHIGRYAADARAQELPLVGGGARLDLPARVLGPAHARRRRRHGLRLRWMRVDRVGRRFDFQIELFEKGRRFNGNSHLARDVNSSG
ncbi:MAG: hypothetical protein M0D55_20095 [Elusimicrobiota bacterium]|nr:MAG: hypothetical protein M0D55_20095 [Elusimicrobiota bacterium]